MDPAPESTMKTEFENRHADLLKEVEQLSTLTGVKACAIIYSGDDPVPVTWPEDPSAVVDVIREYKRQEEGFDSMVSGLSPAQLRQLRDKLTENIAITRRRRLQLLEKQKGTPPPLSH